MRSDHAADNRGFATARRTLDQRHNVTQGGSHSPQLALVQGLPSLPGTEHGLQLPGVSNAMVVDDLALLGNADLATDQDLQPGEVRERAALATEPVESLSLAMERYPLCLHVDTQCTVAFQDRRGSCLAQI